MTVPREMFERRVVRRCGVASVWICVFATLLACSRKSAEPAPRSAEPAIAAEAQDATWRFAVSGDSRNCGDLVMPTIAADAAKHSPAFYWHLGDYRAIFMIDEDMEHPANGRARRLSHLQYLKIAWDDFIKNQITPFSPIPVFLGIGNHEMLFHKDRQDFVAKFGNWLDASAIQEQRLKDDPTDHSVKSYYHWTRGGVDFINMDNASKDQFNDTQLGWFKSVLDRDKSNPDIKTIVVGMHAALPESISRGHSMNESKDGEKSGIQVYKELWSAQNDAHKHVYVLASHSHFFMDGVYNTAYWRQNAGVLPGWIVGTAGAARIPLPEKSGDALKAMVNVYGYLVATVNPDGQKDDTIRFEFQQLEKQSVPPAVRASFTPTFVDWCFDQNFQPKNELDILKSMEKRVLHR